MSAARQRRFLFLQGPLSPLYSRIARALVRAGHGVHRINLNVGDALQWRGPGAETFRGRFEAWPDHVARRLDALAITDVVLHSDKRPYHVAALAAARDSGIAAHVTELGLLRAGYLTLVQGTAGELPSLPTVAGEIRRLAAGLAAPDLAHGYPHAFWRVAVPDVVYNLSQTLLWPLYPGYRRHTIYFPPVEYAAWVGRLAGERGRAGAAARKYAAIAGAGRRHFVFPLQLEGDFQIRCSRFASQARAIAEVIGSFARHAPAGVHLVLKSHPLDNGLERWPALIGREAERLGVDPRVHFVDGGALAPWISTAAGVVTVNSTAGLEALMAGKPVLALAPAVYDIAGMTHVGGPDTFWGAPQDPDARLVSDFVAVLAASRQVRGSLYDARGLDDAVASIADRLLAYDGAVGAPVRVATA